MFVLNGFYDFFLGIFNSLTTFFKTVCCVTFHSTYSRQYIEGFHSIVGELYMVEDIGEKVSNGKKNEVKEFFFE